jgi:hypothetical protein
VPTFLLAAISSPEMQTSTACKIERKRNKQKEIRTLPDVAINVYPFKKK